MTAVRWLLRHYKLLLLALLALVILLSIPFLSRLTVEDILALIEYTHNSYLAAGAILCAIYAVKGVVMVLPIFLLYIAAGIFFPLPVALLVTYLGLICEMSVSFLLGRLLGREAVQSLMQKHRKTRAFMLLIDEKGGYASFFARLFPFPFDLVSLYFGTTHVHYPGFIVGSLLGVSPIMIPYVLAGDAILDPLSPQFLLPFASFILISVATLVIFARWQKRHLRNRTK